MWFTISSSVFGKVGDLDFLIKCDFFIVQATSQMFSLSSTGLVVLQTSSQFQSSQARGGGREG